MCYCVSLDFQEHFADGLALERDEKLTGFSRLHKSIFHATIDTMLEGRFQRPVTRALLTSLATPLPPTSEGSNYNPEGSGDRPKASNNGNAKMFKNGQGGQHSDGTGAGPVTWADGPLRADSVRGAASMTQVAPVAGRKRKGRAVLTEPT